MSCGVTQGSVLGPLFCLIYVNDVENTVQNCGIKLYAGDIVLYQAGVNKDEASNKLQRSVNDFNEWCNVNALRIIASITKIMAFAKRSTVKKCKDVKIMIDNKRLKLVPSYKYLGMLLDSTLNYSMHITLIVNVVSYKRQL